MRGAFEVGEKLFDFGAGEDGGEAFGATGGGDALQG